MQGFIDQKKLSQGDKVKQRKALWISYLLGGALLGICFGLYLWSLYGQLANVFYQKDQFVPSRIYSDVVKIAPGQQRNQIESRLKSRGYSFSISDQNIQFVLHPIEYPIYLLPDNHPLIAAKNLSVTLQFDKKGQTASLISIQLGSQDILDLYLEPEIVATLSNSAEPRKGIREYLTFEEIPANVWKAIIAIEDQHYLEHKGFDPRGIARAFWVNLKTFSLAQGGSTITQQLVKNLMARRTKNIFQKVNELFLALILESRFEKEAILERYLNEVYLGQVGNLEVHGVSQGAEHFFGKKLEDLNLGETALMAGLIRGPGFYSPYKYRNRAIERQHLVLKKMAETGQIAEEEAKEAAKLPIRLAPPQSAAVRAPFFTDFVKAELLHVLKKNMTEQEIAQAGFKIYTTLDPQLNQIAQRAVTEGTALIEKRFKIPSGQRLEGALACVDHTNGYIRALVGGRNYSQSNFNRILNMKRQVGSTFKPIVYLTAFLKGEDSKGVPYGPAYPVEDHPWKLIYDQGKQSWSPKNYEKEHRGWINLKTALAHSVNTVAARLGQEVGIQSIINTARSLGVTSDLPAVPSLSLGVAELSPIELLKVYSTLANRGIQDELTVIRGITEADGKGYARYVYHPKEVLPPASIDLTTYLLQFVFLEGTAKTVANDLGFQRPAAGKTGTTSNHRDAWFAGYTPQLTTVAWVGMDQDIASDQKERATLTGANSALPIWINFMKQAHNGIPLTSFQQSSLLTEIQIDRHTGKQASSNCPSNQVIKEFYIRGHEPKDQSCETAWPPSVSETSTDSHSF